MREKEGELERERERKKERERERVAKRPNSFRKTFRASTT